MNCIHFALSSLALAVVAFLPAPAGLSAATDVPDLTGTWRLNRELSSRPGVGSDGGDMPGQGGQDGRGRGRGVGAAGRRGGVGRGGGLGGPGGGRRPSDEDMKRMRELMQQALQPEPSFTIARSESSVTFVFPDGRTRTYAANDKTEKHQLPAGTVETRAKWDNGQLVVRTKVSDRVTMVQTYARQVDAQRLVVTSKLVGPRDRPGLTHVYELSERLQP